MRRNLLPRSRSLRGLLAISDYTGLEPETIMKWARDSAFPAKPDRHGKWVMTTAAMDRWVLERRVDKPRATKAP